VALIPKSALSSKRAATIAVIVSLVGLLVIPVITVPVMLVAGFGWRSAPRWARLLLVIAAVVYAACVLTVKPHAPAAQH
jgi:protein-S-isoprenylcysteine O-methyltransferase Ste14